VAFFGSIVGKLKQGLEKTREAVVTGTRGLRSILTGRKLDDELISEIERRLLEADAGLATTTALIEDLRRDFRAGEVSSGEDAIAHLKGSIAALWPPEDRALRIEGVEKPAVVLVTGVNGAGKTTSIAKLAWLLRAQGKSVMLGACDTFRAGAVAQLETWAQRLGVEIVKGRQGGDPAAVAFDACAAAKSRGVDVLILDTAGRLQTQDPLMRQLTKLVSVVGKQVPGAPHETLLVLDATAGQNALRQAQEFSKAAGVTGIFLAKLDGTAKGGVVIAVRGATDIPVKFVGVGETPQDVQAFDPVAFAEALLGE